MKHLFKMQMRTFWKLSVLRINYCTIVCVCVPQHARGSRSLLHRPSPCDLTNQVAPGQFLAPHVLGHHGPLTTHKECNV